MTTETIVLIVGLCSSVSGILFAFLGFRRSDKNDNKRTGKDEGVLIANIAHIKSCIDRLESNVNNVDERYRNVAERLARVEEGMSNIQKRIEELYQKGED